MFRRNIKNHRLAIVHHHAFKCAGSTVMWILEKNFRKKVLYIEGRESGQRIFCEDLLPYVKDDSYRAVSSHLLVIPDLGQNIGEVHVSFLRDPVERIVSAYHYFKKRGEIESGKTLKEFCKSNFQADNFQAKHSSIVGSNNSSDKWEINRRIYKKIEAGEIFFGIVEYFDHSMVMLEDLLKRRGIKFDGAYPERQNVSIPEEGPGCEIDGEIRKLIMERNVHDIELYEYVKQRFLDRFYERFEEKDLEPFRLRCAKLKRKWWKIRSVVMPSHEQRVFVG